MAAHRLAFVTIGQAPRPDVTPEVLRLLDLGAGAVAVSEFGALDGLSDAAILSEPPNPREGRLHTRLIDGRPVVVGAGLVGRRLEVLLAELDGRGFDLIVLTTTGVHLRPWLRTALVHGQVAVDRWIEPLMMGACQLGLVYPLVNQHQGFAHGTLIQNACTVSATGETATLEAASGRLAETDLILMHSVGYSEEMAATVARETRKPVVTARRILASAIRHLLASCNAIADTGISDDPLTPREREVLAALLDGANNKEAGRLLGISHRTVEIHRARALSKLNAASLLELSRRGIMLRPP